MFNISMKKGIRSNDKRQYNHCPFKKCIVNNINPKQRKRRKYKGQHSTMYGTGNGSCNTKSVPVQFNIHTKGKGKKNAILLQVLAFR